MHNIKCWQALTRYCFCSVAFCVCINLFSTVLFNTALAYSVEPQNDISQISEISLKKYWQQIEKEGKNQSVYFHAWGGDPQINAYIQWVAQKVKAKYNITLHHVKLSDTSEAVSRVLAEKSANNNSQGNVDLVWINGANFATMAQHSLLLKGWANKQPNFIYTDPEHNPAVTLDFGVPTQGMESPWGQASLTFYYDQLASNNPPRSLYELLRWSKKNPGRFSYPKPPDFLGLSFLKYALVVLHQDSFTASNALKLKDQHDDIYQDLLYAPATPENIEEVLKPLWAFLNKLHPSLWRKGQHFMQTGVEMRRLVDDTELSLGFTFSGPEIPAAVKRYDLPKSIRSYAMADGSLSNTHFVAIPYNASHAQSAQLVANFLLSPEAQAYKQQAEIWGDKTVLIASTLTPEQQNLFKTQTPHPSALAFNSITRTLSEPHPSWVEAITLGWQQRFGVAP
ncbi:ABC transporter substrate-binding protein [Colwellia sp. UCD-KL20]|uniref:ABC transporter substrate-binding protein n=1 Tax=Colwellia sp. UCD-KL20 TaxID=1917165 RepID=UPI00097081FF|nr:ABC transporter substrate-binding protein [Colwellia sp. UCD-KL20]